jgi:hypothetical protein
MRLQLVLGLSLFAAALATPEIARAQGRGVGLGVAAGIAIPDSTDGNFDPSFNWGFFVDIPLISTFHITPSTIVRKIDPAGAATSSYNTDVSLNFKFMIPLGVIEPFGGVIAGLTATNEIYPHVGLAAGANFNLIANLGAFVQVNYKLVLYGEPIGNVRDLQIYAGPLFHF